MLVAVRAGALGPAVAALPVQFGSSGLEWRAAFRRIYRGELLEARLPDYSLQRLIGPRDRVVFLGENDRFYCPVSAAWRYESCGAGRQLR